MSGDFCAVKGSCKRAGLKWNPAAESVNQNFQYWKRDISTFWDWFFWSTSLNRKNREGVVFYHSKWETFGHCYFCPRAEAAGCRKDSKIDMKQYLAGSFKTYYRIVQESRWSSFFYGTGSVIHRVQRKWVNGMSITDCKRSVWLMLWRHLQVLVSFD